MGKTTSKQHSIPRKATTRHYVALDASGHPFCQRTSLRAAPYLSATPTGRFSSNPPQGAYSCKVVEVERPIEWISHATLPDGTKVSQRSRSGPTGRNYILYAYNRNGYSSEHLPAREEKVAWSNCTADEYMRRHLGASSLLSCEIVTWVAGTVEVRNWPTPGDSIVLPDVA